MKLRGKLRNAEGLPNGIVGPAFRVRTIALLGGLAVPEQRLGVVLGRARGTQRTSVRADRRQKKGGRWYIAITCPTLRRVAAASVALV